MAVGEYALTSWTKAASIFGYLSDEQAKVEMLIDTATSRMEQYARRKIKARTFTDSLLDGYGRSNLLLPEYPANSITSIIPDSDRAFGASLALASSDYSLEIETGIVRLFSGSWPEGPATVKVTYNAGYDEDHPYWPLIESACLEFVQWLKVRFAGQIGKRTETNADGMSVGFEIDMPLNVKQVLDDIRRHDR